MIKLSIKTLIICSILALTQSVQAQNGEYAKTIKLKTETNVANLEIAKKDNYIKAKYASAENRFLQGNVKASRDDFSELIKRVTHDDYVFLVYAMKMAEYGFFDLSEELINKLDKNLYTENYVNDIHKFYFPSGMVNPKDTVYLSDAYASIVYNNLAIETTSELLSSSQAVESDYKNYLISLGFYKSNNLNQALKYINNAIVQNNTNVNYKILKTKILADMNKPKLALKTLKELNKNEFKTVDFQNKIKAIEEYVMYKNSKDEALKDYHLSYYYHLQEKSLLATKVLQAAILHSKNHSSLIFGLLSRIYYENNENLKAQEFANRAYKENNKNYLGCLTLADLSFEERRYEDALNYYKEAKRIKKDEIIPSIGVAKSYLALNKEKKSKKLYEKLLKEYSNEQELLMDSLKVFPQRADDYLPKVVAVDITNNDVWLGLTNLAIKDGNFSMAETFLNNSYYLDESNYKYYYYLSQVLKAKGEDEKSQQSLIRCMRLNSDYELDKDMGR